MMDDRMTHINTKDKILKINSVKKLYHGSNIYFENVDLNHCQPFKDFGIGYYLTTDKAQALKWARRKAGDNGNAYIYSYSLRKPIDSEMHIRELLKYDKEWVDYITSNRTEGTSDIYDIVYDRIADNNWTNITQMLTQYKAGQIRAEDVIARLRKQDSSADQYCFKTLVALSHLATPRCFVSRRDSKGRWNAPVEMKGGGNG